MIASSRVKIYSDVSLTQLVATVNGSTAASQAIAVTGLNPSTNYWAVAEATDSNGLTGTSAAQTFATSAATYVFSGSGVTYSSSYDTLDVDIAVACQGATFTACGIQFSTTSDFSGSIISGVNTTPPANDFVDEVSGFSEHTTYYYRYYATSTEFGTQYYAPTGNTVTTRYDEPVVTCGITSGTITDTNATAWINYAGNYPVTNLSLTITAQGGSAEYIQIQNMSGLQGGLDLTQNLGHPLTPNTTYTLQGTADYYTPIPPATATFTTLPARPSIVISSVSDITPSGATVNISIS